MDPVDRRLVLAGAGIAGVAALSRLAKAGPLDAPPGPISPTGKTLQQIYDRCAKGGEGATAEARICVNTLPGSPTAMHIIDQPGTYYLSDNVTAQAGMCCIEMRCDHIQLECDGYCFFYSQGAQEAIRCVPGGGASVLRCICVYDGGFVGWSGACCDLSHAVHSNVEECWFDRCNSGSAGTTAFVCELGDGGVCDDCDFRACSGLGACRMGANGVIEESLCSDGTCSVCFTCGTGSTMEDNYCKSCTGVAFTCADRCIVLYNRCVACGTGLECSGGYCTIEDNDFDVALGSPGNGISLHGPDCCVSCNRISGGGGGGGSIIVYPGANGCLIEDNACSGASAAGDGDGGLIAVLQGATRCHVVCNRVRRVSTAGIVVAPGNSYGPLVVCPDAGDLSAIPGATHPWANFLH